MLNDTARGNLFHLKVGDHVMVRTHSQTVEAEVIKRGRMYFTAKWLGANRADEFSMETGGYRYEGDLRVFSLEQHEANTRRNNVVCGLREAGFDLRIDNPLSLETLEKVLELIRKETP